MADNDTNGADDSAPGAAPAQEPAPEAAQEAEAGIQTTPMLVRAHYLKDFSFENPKAPTSLMEMTGPPDVQVNVNVDAMPVAGGDFEVSLTITGEASTDGATVFVVEITYAGLFTLNDVPPEHQGPMLLIEAPRLLFPFARRMIADATGEGGFPPLSIQPIDFVALYQQHLAAQQAEANAEPQA